MRIIDINLNPTPQLLPPLELRKRFLILAKAYSLGLIDSEGSLGDLMACCANLTEPTMSDLIVRTVIAEGPYAEHTI